MSDYIWIEGNQAHTSGANGPITRIVLHATVSPCEIGGARKVARYFQSDSAGGLAHFICDPTETVQACREDIAAFHAPPNHGSLGVELCDPQTGNVERWYDELHMKMLSRAAVLVADLCARHNVPVEYVNADGLLRGRHGITMHSDVSSAFHKSTHTDPGAGFPMARFIDLVRAAQNKPTPIPAPAPAPVHQEDDMALLIKGSDTKVWVTNGITKRWVRDATDLHTLVQSGLVAATIHKVSDAFISVLTET